MPDKEGVILICIDGHPKTGGLIRAAARKAKQAGKAWYVLHVDEGRKIGKDAATRIVQFITLAEELGAKVVKLEHPDAVRAVIDFYHHAEESDQPIRQVILGQQHREGFWAEIRKSFAEKVKFSLPEYVDVQIVPLPNERYTQSWFSQMQLQAPKFMEIVWAFAAVAIATLIASIIAGVLPVYQLEANDYNLIILYVVACGIVAAQFGIIPALVAALASFFVINYRYIPPKDVIHIKELNDLINLVLFLASAIVLSLVNSLGRANIAAARKRERRIQALYDVQRISSTALSTPSLLELLHKEMEELLEMDVAFFLPNEAGAKMEAICPKDISMKDMDRDALELAWIDMRATGYGTFTGQYSTRWRFIPMLTADRDIGVLGVKVPSNMHIDSSFGRLLNALADQAASAIENRTLNDAVSKSRFKEEREKLRAMLLSSVSHDLKTPLASIIGSLSVYQSLKGAKQLTEEQANTLTETALDEAQRLNSFISNILDMSRIESGDIEFSMEWYEPIEPIQRTLKRLRQQLRHHEVEVKDFDESLLVEMDTMMIEQVLQNVIDNASKYAPKGTVIEISMKHMEDGKFAYLVRDHGKGIKEKNLESVFDKYERLNRGDSQVAGTGLGLAICKSIMHALGGDIIASNHKEGGAMFKIILPNVKPLDKAEIEAA